MAEPDGRFSDALAAACSGDVEAFAQLWRATHPVLIRYLRVVCGDRAEDVASEAWIKAIQALPAFTGDEQGFRGWMVTIARNHWRDVLRREARHPEVPTSDGAVLGALYAHQASDRAGEADVADVVLQRWSTERALRLVATLPPDQAELVMLRVVVGLDVADVARIVGRSSGAVRVAVHRALRTLAERVGPAGSVTLDGQEALSRRNE